MKNKNIYASIIFLGFSSFLACHSDNRIPQPKTEIHPTDYSTELVQNRNHIKRKILPPTPACLEDHLCWGNVLPEDSTYLTGTSQTDLWAFSYSTGLYHFDGAQWSVIPNSTDYLTYMWTDTPNQLWMLTNTFSFKRSFVSCQPTGCQELGQFPDTDWSEWKFLKVGTEFWFFGLPEPPHVQVYHFDGMQFSAVDFPALAKNDIKSDYPYFLGQLWASSDKDLWAVLGKADPNDDDFIKIALVHWDGKKIDKQQELTEPTTSTGVWDVQLAGTSSDDIWLHFPKDKNYQNTDYNSVFFYYDGKQWTKKMDLPFSLHVNLDRDIPFIFQPSQGAMWMQASNQEVGYNQIWLWQNKSWQLIKAGVSSFIFASDVNNLWWKSDNSYQIETNHPTWASQQEVSLNRLLYDGQDTLWFMGRTGQSLVRYQKGDGFQEYSLYENLTVATLWVNDQNREELWIATTDGRLIHTPDIRYKGTSTYLIQNQNLSYVSSIWGDQAHGLWAAVTDGRVLRFQSPNWVVERESDTKTSNNPSIIQGSDSNTLWIGGTNTLLRGEIQTSSIEWTVVSLPPSSENQYTIQKIWNAEGNHTWFSVDTYSDPLKTHSKKLLHYDGQKFSWQDLPFTRISDLAGDKDGNLWALASQSADSPRNLWYFKNGGWLKKTSINYFDGLMYPTKEQGLFLLRFGNDWLWEPTN